MLFRFIEPDESNRSTIRILNRAISRKLLVTFHSRYCQAIDSYVTDRRDFAHARRHDDVVINL